MLHSVVVGDLPANADNFKLGKDEYGSSFVSNEDIRQRIRFAKNVDAKLNKISGSIDNKNHIKTASFELPNKIFFSNSFKNMNMNIVNFVSKDKELMNSYIDDNVVYLTLSVKEFKLLEYHLHDDAEILYTYNKKNEYIGCAIVFKGKEIDNLFTLYVKNNKRFTSVILSIKNGMIEVKFSNTVTKDTLKHLTTVEKKLAKRFIKFKMQVKDRLLTSTYICDLSIYNDVEELTKNIKNSAVIVLDKNSLSDNKGFISYNKLKNEAKEIFDECILDKNVRAITLCGIQLPKEFTTDYKILYMFDYDLKTNKLKCIKSN